MKDHHPWIPKIFSWGWWWGCYDFEGFSLDPAWKLELLVCHFSDTKRSLRGDELFISFGSDADATRTGKEGVWEKEVII